VPLVFPAMTRSERLFAKGFQLAAGYNLVWGLTVAVFPNLLFELLGVTPVNYPFLMSGIGMFVAVYAYGYWAVSRDLLRYPQLVVVGLLGKTLGPIGWAFAVWRGEIPAHTLVINVFNDLIWLPLFVAYLAWYRRRQYQARA
jgi:small multidrug resistance pump